VVDYVRLYCYTVILRIFLINFRIA
jgi:hypothetical protein